MSPINIVILAAGHGTRMNTSLPKVLHLIGNKPILKHVVECAKSLAPSKIIVVYNDEALPISLSDETLTWVRQGHPQGTAHAVLQALPHLEANTQCLILLGDVPLVGAEICLDLIHQAQTGLAVATFTASNPSGYGRIVRNDVHQLIAIVEERDATPEQRSIQEVNSGIIATLSHHLHNWLPQIKADNAQGEYYLTDIIKLAVAERLPVSTRHSQQAWRLHGINTLADLARQERAYQFDIASNLLMQGVRIHDPQRIEVRGILRCGKDVSIDVNCVFEGDVQLGDGVHIAAHCVIKNAVIAKGTRILPFTHIDGATIGQDARIGPYARLRPDSQLGDCVHIGNFVEIKNSQIGETTKINHLSYIGDATIGRMVNIGAGVVTCNYDGANKYKTIIKDHVFIGSDVQLIAPLTIEEYAYVGTGSVLTKNAPAHALTLCRSREQRTISNWLRPVKKEQG